MAGNLPPGCTQADIDRAYQGDEPLHEPTREEQEADAWEYWHQRAHEIGTQNEKQHDEIVRLWGALEVIAGFGSVPLAQEWPDGLRDIISAMTDCARRTLAEGKAPAPRYVIPISCWKPREGTGIPADAQMHPPGCPDAEYCRGNRCCNWNCKAGPDDDLEDSA